MQKLITRGAYGTKWIHTPRPIDAVTINVSRVNFAWKCIRNGVSVATRNYIWRNKSSRVQRSTMELRVTRARCIGVKPVRLVVLFIGPKRINIDGGKCDGLHIADHYNFTASRHTRPVLILQF